MKISNLDLLVVLGYFAVTLWIGFWSGRKEKKTADDYFLARTYLPWYTIGASLAATTLSTEHFVGMVGSSYQHGLVVANYCWLGIGTVFLIWVFLPYYLRSGLYTMPEFLERRYDPSNRLWYAVITTLTYIAAFLAAVLYAGGLALHTMFGWSLVPAILLVAITTGAYTIYGGLQSTAWSALSQFVALFIGGLLVAVISISKAGGIGTLMSEQPDMFHLLTPASHPVFPFLGILLSGLTVGIWYNSTNQFYIQLCLGGKDEWHGRAGALFNYFLLFWIPFLVVIPGIAARKLYPNLAAPDLAMPTMVRDLLPSGLTGFVLAGLIGAIMSTVSSVLNSTSTVVSLDLYKRFLRPDATPRQVVRFGKIAGIVILTIGATLAPLVAKMGSLFVYIQNIYTYVAPPFAVIFLAGVFWWRATGRAALLTTLLGIPFAVVVERILFPDINFLYRGSISFVFCVIVLVAVSTMTAAPDWQKVKSIIWTPAYARVPSDLRGPLYKNLAMWHVLFGLLVLIVYLLFA
ncbi:MAG: SLC5 family protein [Acidobacteriota bacterium]